MGRKTGALDTSALAEFQKANPKIALAKGCTFCGLKKTNRALYDLMIHAWVEMNWRPTGIERFLREKHQIFITKAQIEYCFRGGHHESR